MNSFAAVVFFAALAAANASVIAPLAYSAIPTGHIVQGPSSRTTVVGPDGSAISSVAPGGTIITDHDATIVAQAAPAAVIAPAARLAVAHTPLVAAHSSLVAAHSPLVAAHPQLIAAPGITTYAANVPVLSHQAVAVPALGNIAAENTVVAGPSGTITQSRSLDAAQHVTVW
ncbi:cuticle protein LPCP-23-like [Coccinella septempunctata]|uniref:cuticle protein LPCP-23-like n=1 Tax=Coccinella septempunctata TaxID=41139 RepID=UPI001D0766E6|nr:cuticle protein LPCP-23-like [Coccinella septempunctata]